MYPRAVIQADRLTILRGVVDTGGDLPSLKQDFFLALGSRILGWMHNPTVEELRVEFEHLPAGVELCADFGDEAEPVVAIELDVEWGDVVFTGNEAKGYTALVH